MESLFDFDAIHGDAQLRRAFPHALRRHARVTGPYAKEILEERLGAEPGTVMNGSRCRTSAAGIRTRTWCTRTTWWS
jgi:hypothetical protein